MKSEKDILEAAKAAQPRVIRTMTISQIDDGRIRLDYKFDDNDPVDVNRWLMALSGEMMIGVARQAGIGFEQMAIFAADMVKQLLLQGRAAKSNDQPRIQVVPAMPGIGKRQ